MVDGSLNFDTRIDTDGFDKGTRDISGMLDSFRSAIGKLGTAIAAAFSVKALVDFGAQAIETASDLQEVQNVVDTAFGDMSDRMESFADTAIEQFGISELAAKRTSSVFMAMSTSMGIAKEAASDMALELTGLSADMASFYDVEQSVVSTALKSVFTGETETLKHFGIVMTEANLQAFALSQGITKSVSKMSQAEKVQLRYAYIMEQTALAQGDFAKTSNSWANQTRMLSERWKEFSSTLGGVMMQVASPAVQTLNRALSSLISYAQTAADALADLFGWEMNSSFGGALVDATALAAENYEDIADSAETAKKANEKSLASFDDLNILTDNSIDNSSLSVADMSSPVTQADAAAVTQDIKKEMLEFSAWVNRFMDSSFVRSFSSFGSGLSAVLNKSFKTVSQGVDKWLERDEKRIKETTDLIVAAFDSGFKNIKRINDNVFGALGDSTEQMREPVSNAFANLLSGFSSFGLSIGEIASGAFAIWTQKLADWTEDNKEKITEVFNSFQQVGTDLMNLFGNVFGDIGTTLSTWWNDEMSPVVDKLSAAVLGVGDTVMNVWLQWIYPVIQKVVSWANAVWEQHLHPLFEKMLSFISKVGDFVATFWNNFLKPVIDWLVKTLKPVVMNVVGNILACVETAIGVITGVVGGLYDALGGLLDFLTGVFSGDWKKAWTGIKDFFKGIWDTIWSTVKGVINLCIDAINSLWRGLYSGISAVVNGLGGIFEGIGSVVGIDLGWSIPSEPPVIPKLATGAVIPPNREFAAILGDQKHGRNLEAPEDLIRQIVREETANQSFEMHFTGTMAQFVRALMPEIKRETRRETAWGG